jgi:hypothetical protein
MVLSKSLSPERFEKIYSEVALYRQKDAIDSIDQLRLSCDAKLRRILMSKIDAAPSCLPVGLTRDGFAERLSHVEPFVLLDVPVKQPTTRFQTDTFCYLPEDFSGVRGREERFPTFKLEPVLLGNVQFDHSVGKVRVFVPGEWADFIAETLTTEQILSTI